MVVAVVVAGGGGAGDGGVEGGGGEAVEGDRGVAEDEGMEAVEAEARDRAHTWRVYQCIRL